MSFREERWNTKQEANEGHGYLSYKLGIQFSIFRLLMVSFSLL